MKNKFYLLLLALGFMFPVASFSACGAENTTPTEETTPSTSFTDFTVTYKPASTNLYNGMLLEFNPEFNLSASDFEITLNDITGTKVSSNVNYRVYKIVNTERIDAENYELGDYVIKFTYGNVDKEFTFEIIPAVLNNNNVTITGLKNSYPYDANGVFPEPTFSYGNTLLVKDVDYLISYGENNVCGENTGIISIYPAGNYQAYGQIDYYFNISKLEPEQIVFENKTLTYNGENQENELSVNVDEYEGISSVSFEFYQNDERVWTLTDVGTYQIVAHIHVEDNYEDVNDAEFQVTIQQKNISNTNITNIGLGSVSRQFRNFAFTSDDFIEEVQTALNHNQFEILMSSGANVDNLNSSTSEKQGKFIVSGTNNYCGSFEVPYTITPKDLSNSTFTNLNDSSNYVYDGSAKQLRTVHAFIDYNYVLLTENQDYELTFTNSNVLAGTCNFNIRGIGNYTGLYNGSITIDKKQITVQEPVWSTTQLTYNKTDQLSQVNITNLPAYIVASYQSYSEYTQTYKQQPLTNAGTYTVEAQLSFSNDQVAGMDEFNNAYSTNYELTNTKFTTEIVINKAVATAEFVGSSSRVYNGEAYYPENIVVSATIGNQNEQLTKNTDYTLSYPTNPVNVFHKDEFNNDLSYYQIDVNLISNNYYFDMAGQESYNLPLYYYITQKTLTFGNGGNATINYPVVYKNLWSYPYLLDITNAQVRDSELNQNVDVIFGIVNNNAIHVELNSSYSNYNTINLDDLEIVPADVEIRNNIFEFVKINGTALNTNEIANLSNVRWGDKIEISCLNGFDASYILLASGSEIRYIHEQNITSIAGKEIYIEDVYDNNHETIIHHSGEPYNESDVRIYVYNSENQSTTIAGRDLSIIRGALFNELNIANTTCVPTTGYKDGYLNNLNTEFLAQTGDEIIADLLDEYKAFYDVQIIENFGGNQNIVDYNPTTGYEIDFSAVDYITLKIINNQSNEEIISVDINERQ